MGEETTTLGTVKSDQSLDEKVDSNSSGRLITQEQFLYVIERVSQLYEIDRKRRDIAQLDSVKNALARREPSEGIPLSMVYQSAEELGYPTDYVDKAMSIFYPSATEMLADLKKHGSVPTFDNIREIYKSFLIRSLVRHVPLSRIGDYESWTNRDEDDKNNCKTNKLWIYQSRTLQMSLITEKVIEKEVKRFLRKKKKVEEVETDITSLVHLEFFPDEHKDVSKGKYGLTITLKDPLFLRLCGDTLKELREEFKDIIEPYNVKHRYVV